MALIFGTPGNDTVTGGTAGADEIATGLGSDWVLASAGADLYDLGYDVGIDHWKRGGDELDTVDYSLIQQAYANATGGVKLNVDLQLGVAFKQDGTGATLDVDTLIGVDRIVGSDGNDTIAGRSFWTYEEFAGMGGDDRLDGRGGLDAVTYDNATTAGIAVNLALGTVSSVDAGVGNDTLRGIEIVGGTGFADAFVATGFGAGSANADSFGSGRNVFRTMGGNDTVTGNGATALDFGRTLGGSVVVSLAGQTTASTVAAIVTAFSDDPQSKAGYAAGTIQASGVYGVFGGNYNDTLRGGGDVNGSGVAAAGGGLALSTNDSLEIFRGNGGNDLIEGGSGLDRAAYDDREATRGINVSLASGIVTGDRLLVGTDTLRGVEAIESTPLDDRYSAVGFTTTKQLTPSANAGDIVFVAGVANPNIVASAFNEFRAIGGNDSVSGNGATQIAFTSMPIENPTGALPAVVVHYTLDGTGTATFGNTDGGLGTVTFTGTPAILGSQANDLLTGAGGTQVLRGNRGNDTLVGGDGNDALYGLAGSADVPAATPTGYTDNDVLNGGAGDDLLDGDLGTDALDGGAGNDSLRGDAGNDTLVGGAGDDTMAGGGGADVYYVEATADLVVETLGLEIDLVYSSLATYGLTANVEWLTLTGGAVQGGGNGLANRITGTGGANSLFGLAGNDTLVGNGGNDNLDGGLGNDNMQGGAGADRYRVDSAADLVSESGANVASERDTVFSTVSYTLPTNIEDLFLTGGAANGTGNALANLIEGTDLANVLRGGASSDTLRGRGGADTFVLDSKIGFDTLQDWQAADTVRVSQATLRIGDGDTLVEGATVRSAPGGFGTAAELVIFQNDLTGFSTTSAAAAIGAASVGSYAVGATRLFVVDNGAGNASALYLFTSANADNVVGAAELTLLAVLNGSSATTVGDYLFGP